MKLSVTCKCGRKFSTDGKNAGRSAKCPNCKEPLTIPSAPELELDPVVLPSTEDMSMEIKLGSVESIVGKLDFKFTMHSSGDGHLRIYAFDPSDMRKSGVMLFLDESGYVQLKTVMTKLENTIQQLQMTKRMNKQLVVRLE